MANFSIKADLLKVKGAFVTNLKGKTATKSCICIPIEDSGLYLGEKGCYLNLTAIELKEAKFADTHCIKVSYDKDVYEKMSEEEKKAQPIIGGMHQLEKASNQMSVSGTTEMQDDAIYGNCTF